ncbi:MAG: thiol peroxidase [Alphaproteobacteria bacterium]|nr:MAG: thiol peroxidase [Alphaproteobacteria bacterium]
MTKLKLHGNYFNTEGSVPDLGSIAHDFTMVKTDLSEIMLSSFKQKNKILNIFPSIDTEPCSNSVRQFNKMATDFPDTVVVNLSMDLPFAHKRFCATEGITNVEMGSLFRSNFFKYYPIEFTEGPFKGLCSRVVLILNEKNEIKYAEQVLEVSEEPNYEAALSALQN